MDFRLGEKSDLFRKEAAAFLDEVVTPEMVENCHRTGVNHDVRFSKALRDKGWLSLDWPVELGGAGRDPMEVLAFTEEMGKRAAPTYGIGTTMTIAKVIAELGTDEQKAEILPRALNADIVIVLGFTEPENGSDAAAAATRAVRSGDGWTINGSKMFTTNAHIADYVFLLARTNPEAAKHRGLTTFLVPLKQDGVEVQAVHTLSGERTNITYYHDVHVPDRYRIGEVDAGWQVMGTALIGEHTTSFSGEQHRLVDGFVSWAREAGRDDDPAVLERIGRSRAELEVSSLLVRRAVWLQAQGSRDAHGAGSMAKLFSSERLQVQAEQCLSLAGPDSLRARGDETAVAGGTIEHMVRHAKGTTIYAGTSEIQRNIVAQHVLGLPRPS